MKGNKQTYWINVTSIYNWKRPSVGIIRVETEFVKNALSDEKHNFKFFIYNQDKNRFLRIERKEVLNLIKLLQESTSYSVTDRNSLSVSQMSINKMIKQQVFSLKNKMPFALGSTYWSILSKLRLAYRILYLEPRYHLNINKKRFNNKIRSWYSRRIKNIHQKAIFENGDRLITMGLDWDYLDLKTLYKLKQKYNLKVYTVCYDIIPVKYPQLCVFDVANIYSNYFVNLSWLSDHIFCISKNTQKDLKSYLSLVGAPIPESSVIRLGDSLPVVDSTEASEEVQSILNNKYILFVSTIERRKNHETIYKAYRRIVEKNNENIPLMVFVGMKGWGVNDLFRDLEQDPLIQGRVKVLSNVNDSELDMLFRNCLFTVFPSLYEGWGLPVAESIAYGKFCLASNSSSIPEVGGELLEYIDPWDVLEWSKRISYYINNSEKLIQKEKLIKKNYKLKSWKLMSKKILLTISHDL